MTPKHIIALLLTVYGAVISADDSPDRSLKDPIRYTDTMFRSPIDTLSYGDSRTPTPIFLDRIILARPVITLKSCPLIAHLYDYNQIFSYLSVHVNVDLNPLESAGQIKFTHGKVGKFDMDRDKEFYGFFEDMNNTRIYASVVFSENANDSYMYIACLTTEKCYRLFTIINTNISALDALRFNIVGVAMGLTLRSEIVRDIWEFHGVRIATPIKLNCSWNVIQEQSYLSPLKWENHELGYMDDDDYWIGLTALQLITDKKNRPHHKCKLRIELEDWDGNIYWGQWNQFQVMGADDNYQLKVGEEVDGTLINDLAQYGNLQFSKSHNFSWFKTDYYRYYYRYPMQPNGNDIPCTLPYYQRVGWWFNPCFTVKITKPSFKGSVKSKIQKAKAEARDKAKSWVPMMKSIMKVNCD